MKQNDNLPTAAQKRKKQLKIKTAAGMIIRLIFFILMPAAFSAGFNGVKSLVTEIGRGEPLGMNGFVMTLIGLAGFTVLSGRFFCGYVCAFGTLGDAVYGLSGLVQKKVLGRKKQISIPDKAVPVLQKIKYILLLLIVILCAAGIYGSLNGYSPWDVFSKLTAFRLPDGEQIIGIILLALIIIGMALQKRFFCQFLCPMGAVFALLPVMPFSAISSNKDSCLKGCSACRRNCPVRIKPGEDKFRDGECIACEKCMNICPKSNISRPTQKIIKNEIVFLIVRALLFLAMGCFLGMCRL